MALLAGPTGAIHLKRSLKVLLYRSLADSNGAPTLYSCISSVQIYELYLKLARIFAFLCAHAREIFPSHRKNRRIIWNLFTFFLSLHLIQSVCTCVGRWVNTYWTSASPLSHTRVFATPPATNGAQKDVF